MVSFIIIFSLQLIPMKYIIIIDVITEVPDSNINLRNEEGIK